ncbi:MAG: hypothetical protein FWC10_06925 [Lentimicrobiaceae bacterium]|nr:hypothetical protein [Lentimicrobiaceae bacterium]
MSTQTLNLGHEERFFAKLILQNKKQKRQKQLRFLTIAASLLLLITLPFYFYYHQTETSVAESPFSEEVQEVIKSYQTKLDAEIAEIKMMSCYAQMQNEIAEIQKNDLPAEELAILPVAKQLYYIKQIYDIKIEAVIYMQGVCGS